MPLDHLHPQEPTVESVCGFDPTPYIGGCYLGSDQSGSLGPDSYREVQWTLQSVYMKRVHESWDIAFDCLVDGNTRNVLSVNITHATISKSSDGAMIIIAPYIGTFKVLLPGDSTQRTIQRTMHEIRSLEVFKNN